MTNSPLRILLLSTILLALGAAPSLAATPAQIHQDAADGSIDGSYTLAEMRAADREVSAEQREYFGWEDVYRDHVRSLSTPPPAPAPAPGRRPGRDSAPGSSESSSAPSARRSPDDKSPGKTSRRGGSGSSESSGGEERGSSSSSEESLRDDEQVTSAAPASERVSRAGTGNDGLPLAWSLAAIPLLILAAGAWRMRRVRARRPADA